MKKNKQKKTSLKSAIVLLLLIALLLITSSYAWFTANQTVTVSTLQVNVKASNGLQISADAQNWKTILEKADLTTAAGTYKDLVNQLPEKDLEPVSSIGNVTGGKMDMFYGVVEADAARAGEYYLSSTKQTDATGKEGKYIAFDLFLKVDKDTTIYMTPNSKVTFGDKGNKGLQNAARVAFVTEGSATVDKTPDYMRKLALANGTAKIWEPNYDVHTAAGVAAARDTYGVTTTTTGGSQLPYYGIKAEIPVKTIPMKQLTTENPSDTYFGQAKVDYKTIAESTSTIEFAQLTAGVTKIRVYMWVEGQDVDCENSASGTDIKFDLQFTATAPVVP